jgi:two-component system, repressor protein LuxO
MTEDALSDGLHVYIVGDNALAGFVPEMTGEQQIVSVICRDAETLRRRMAERVPNVVLMDVAHAIGDQALLGRVLLRTRDLPVPVIVIVPDGAVETAVECMRQQAADVVPVSDAARMLPEKLLSHALDHSLLAQVKQLTDIYDRAGGLCSMVGVSPAIQGIFDTIKSVADSQAPVFLSGESGTGKELAAEAVHTLSSQSTGQFVAVNCAAIPKDLLESELFGHEKGSFTGADRQHIGSCERADQGVLFLDEICEMDLLLQSKMLRFLQNQRFTRVGGTEELCVSTRVVAATNRDPHAEVQSGRLREDLYYRLNVVPIHLPPLRERREDIPVLAEYFLQTMCDKYGKYFYGFEADAVRLLLAYPWPGNVRELRNTIERITVLTTLDRVQADLFPKRIREEAAEHDVPTLEVSRALKCIERALVPAPHAAADDGEVVPIAEMERRAILNAIDKCAGDISKAARKLGISRATMYRKLEKYGER